MNDMEQMTEPRSRKSRENKVRTQVQLKSASRKNGADFLFSTIFVLGYWTLETPFLSSTVSWGGYVENDFLAEKYGRMLCK